MKNKNSGITLVSLIVTIIILLILAGVTIAQLTQTNLFGKTQQAVLEAKRTKYIEDIQLAIINTQSDFFAKTDNKQQLRLSQVTNRSESRRENPIFIVALKLDLEKIEWVSRVEKNDEDTELLVISKDEYQILINVDNNLYKATIDENSFGKVKGECLVTFDSNGGSGTVASQKKIAGFSITLPENSFTAPINYSFVSWNTKADGTGETIAPGGKLKITEDTTIYAKWSRNKVSIKYDKNDEDATGEMNDTPVEQGDEISLAENTFTKQYYDFIGWNTKSNGSGTSYTDKESITVNNNMTLFAQWRITDYTIEYTLNGGTVSTNNPTSYTVESENITLTNPTKANYTFDGWTGSNGETKQSTVIIPKGSSGNKTFIANWSANKYNIALDKQSGSGGTSTIYEKYATGFYTNSECTTQMTPSTNGITIPTRPGYTFEGYYTSTNGGGTQYIDANGRLTNNASTTAFTNAGSLYAKWIRKANLINLALTNGTVFNRIDDYTISLKAMNSVAWFYTGVSVTLPAGSYSWWSTPCNYGRFHLDSSTNGQGDYIGHNANFGNPFTLNNTTTMYLMFCSDANYNARQAQNLTMWIYKN